MPGYWSLHGTFDLSGVLVGAVVTLFPFAANPLADEISKEIAFNGPAQRLC